jgi:hypothetical protein
MAHFDAILMLLRMPVPSDLGNIAIFQYYDISSGCKNSSRKWSIIQRTYLCDFPAKSDERI